MLKILTYSMLAFLWLVPLSVLAQSTNEDPTLNPLSFGNRFTYHSKILEEDRIINIRLPENFHESSADHTYPVILIMGSHGDQFFQVTAGIVQHLSAVDRMPESIVVSFHKANYYAPNIYTNGMWGSREMLEFDADPDPFIRHLKEEFFPYLKQHFRAAEFRIIIGVSGSATFPIHAFTKSPGLFQAHFIHCGADMIGMGYSLGTTFIDAFEESLKTNPERKDYLYFSVADGDLDGKENYVNNVNQLEQRIQPFASDDFNMKIDIIPNEHHYDSYLKALLGGF